MLTLTNVQAVDAGTGVVELGQALEQLEALDERKADVVKLRQFGVLKWQRLPSRWTCHSLPLNATGVLHVAGLPRSWEASGSRAFSAAGSTVLGKPSSCRPKR